MNGTIPQTPVAPSATPAPAAPAQPTATTPAAPSAPELDPSNLAYYDRMASQALLQGSQPAEPATPPAPGNGSPPAAPATVAAPPAEAPVAPAAAPEAPAAPVQTSEPAEEPEPTPEEQATWSEGEKRLHKALVKEREKGKESRRQLNELKEKLDKIATPEPKPTPTPPPTQPVPPPAAMEECHTPEQVEALTVQAIAMDGKMTRLAAQLNRNNIVGVISVLKAEGKTKIGETPIDEATPEQLSEYVTSVQEGARYLQAQAEPRKRYLHAQGASWIEACKLIPELADATNPRAQKFVAIVRANPFLMQKGPNWPILAAKYLIGDERTATPAAATVPTPVPTPAAPAATARPAPAAPRTAVAPAPQKSELEGLRAKLADGTATEAEMDRYAVLSINAPESAQA